jgi:transposase
MELFTLGIDLGKTTFHVVGMNRHGEVIVRKRLSRVRERWLMRRTAVVNQIRGLLLERGTTLRKGRRYVDEALPGILRGRGQSLSCSQN